MIFAFSIRDFGHQGSILEIPIWTPCYENLGLEAEKIDLWKLEKKLSWNNPCALLNCHKGKPEKKLIGHDIVWGYCDQQGGSTSYSRARR